MLTTMATRRATIELPSPPDEAREICERVVGELRWDLVGDNPARVRGAEDPARLHCHCPPASAEIELTPADGGTALDVTVRVPAWGIVSSRQARSRLELLVRHIEAAGADRGRPAEPLRRSRGSAGS